MNKKLTQDELLYIRNNYSDLGPTIIAKKLNKSMKYISKKAMQLGLYRGVANSNTARRNKWSFNNHWSYNLGYICGVYLGDGNVNTNTDYFRLSVIDKDFAKATQFKLQNIVPFKSNIKLNKNKKQWRLDLCNTDFANWLVKEFGSANNKIIKLLPTLEANMGMLEGLMDSEGTHNQTYTLCLRMCADLILLETICNQLGIQRGPQHKGVRLQKWQHKSKQGMDMYAYSISIKEWTRVGLGTYIKRKAKNGVIYKKFNFQNLSL